MLTFDDNKPFNLDTFGAEKINMQKLFKNTSVQKSLIIAAAVLVILFLVLLKYFLSGFLGAAALYVVTRGFFLKLIEGRKWKKGWASSFVIFLIIISFVLPAWLILEVLIPQVNEQIQNPKEIIEKFQPVLRWFQTNEFINRFDIKIDQQQLMTIVNRVIGFVPSTLGWVGQMFANIFVALFILWFLLMGNRRMEDEVIKMLPFSDESNSFFIQQLKDLIRSSAYGVPILAVSQGIIAIVGYLIFGVNNALFWGLLTGIASVIPVVGTMIIWIPICIYQLATGDTHNAFLLAIYCLVLVGGIDNVLRFTLLKKMADIHPIITVFGVILGIQLFGVMGLVFGPLLLALPGIFYAIYKMERGDLPKNELLVSNREAAVQAIREHKNDDDVEDQDPAVS